MLFSGEMYTSGTVGTARPVDLVVKNLTPNFKAGLTWYISRHVCCENIERWSYFCGVAMAMVFLHGFPRSNDAMFAIIFSAYQHRYVDHNYVQARRVCYFLWLLAALVSAPTLVARVYVEVFKRQTLTLIQRRTLKQMHTSFLLTLGADEKKYRKSNVQFFLDWSHLKTLHWSFFL